MGYFLEKIEEIDYWLITKVRRWALPFARFAIFLVYFWSGILKLFLITPLNPLISEFLTRMMPDVSLNNFIIVLGVFEIVSSNLCISCHDLH